MSSILRALKKLENEPRHLEENQHLDSKFAPLADTGPQRTFSSIFMMVVGGGIVCGLVILTGWWFFSEESQPPPAVNQNVSLPNSSLDKISPPKSQNVNNIPGSAVSEKPDPSPIKAPAAPETARRTRDQEPAGSEGSSYAIMNQKDISSAEKQTLKETVLHQKTPSLIADEQVTLPAEKPVIAPARTPATPPKTVAIKIPKLNDPDMKLQAITWSRAPQKRIAVINSRIIREGETVSGYLINTINQDDVVLIQEGTKWKLLFR